MYEQSVAKGETVPEGTAIVLTVSKGVEMAEVPDVGGLTSADAKKQLEDAGFSVKTVTVYNDGTYVPDTVKRTGGIAPEAGTQLAKGDTVIIQVYGQVETTAAPESTTAPVTE